MANTERVIVGFVVLFGGLMLTGCQTYSNSKLENEVFRETVKLSKRIPKGFVGEQISGQGNQEKCHYADSESSVLSGRKFRMLKYKLGTDTQILVTWCLNLNDELLKRFREDKLDLSSPSVLMQSNAFYAWNSLSRDPNPAYRIYALNRGSSIVCYKKENKNSAWIRYEGVMPEKASVFDIEQFCPGKIAPEGQVQRYLDLVERFKETYSLRSEIFHVVGSGLLDKVEYLVKRRPELVNAKNPVGQTPLHVAAGYGQKEVAELLIAKGAKVNTKDDKGLTALYYAEGHKHKEIADLLRKHGAVE